MQKLHVEFNFDKEDRLQTAYVWNELIEMAVDFEPSIVDQGIGHWECHGKGYHTAIVCEEVEIKRVCFVELRKDDWLEAVKLFHKRMDEWQKEKKGWKPYFPSQRSFSNYREVELNEKNLYRIADAISQAVQDEI